MSTWNGWQDELLKAAGLPTSADNRTFITDWGDSEKTSCDNNPVVISYQSRGTSDCKRLTTTRTAQNYPSHAAAAAAFASQLRSGNFPHLLAALRDGTPYQVPSARDVIGDLVVWGAEAFAYELTQNYGPPHGGGGGPPGMRAPHALGGWHDVQRSMSRHLPKTLREANRYNVRALQALARARKVRL